MASYITGLTDYIPQIQPFQPDYNFLSNVLQQRQSNYDKNYNQLSSVYSSLFNSPMSREVDIQKKDAFFKSIEQDIKKVSGMDLSLQQNVDAASKVFQPFLDDKNLMNDIVKTKQNQNAIAKHNQLKSCVDPTKCGGEAWDIGLQEQLYKLEEFKKTTDDEALTFGMPEYTPYYNWKKEAIKGAKELDYNVTQETINGPYIVTNTNGELVKGGLYSIYKTMYGDDPRIDANYKTKAYVQRKNVVANTVGQYGSEESAERIYMLDQIKNGNNRVNKMMDHFQGISDDMREAINAKEKKKKSEGLIPDDIDIYRALINNKNGIDKASKSLEIVHNGINNNADNEDINVLRNRADISAAFEFEERDLMEMATTMSSRGKKTEIKAEPFALAQKTSDLALRNSLTLAEINNVYDKDKISAELKAKMDYHDYEQGINSGAFSPGPKILEGLSGSTVQDESARAGYDKNFKDTYEFIQTVAAKSDNFIWNAFLTAKAAALPIDPANPSSNSAKNYLTNNFGKGWSKINTQEEFVNYLAKNKKSSSAIFKNTIVDFNPNKNIGVDVSWAKAFMDNKGDIIHEIQEENITKGLMATFQTKNNKEVVESMLKQVGKDNYVYGDSDLLLSPVGFLVSKPLFEQRYNDRYANYAKKGNAEDAYDILTTKFFKDYNNKKGVLLTQAGGLNKSFDGTGTTTSRSLLYENISPLKKGNPGYTNALNLLNTITQNSHTTITGGGDEDNVNDKESSPALDNFIKYFKNDIVNGGNKGYKGEIPTFNLTERPTLGGDANKSGITLDISPSYVEQFIGNEKKKGLLYDLKDEIADGITLYYNNKEVQTSTSKALRLDPLLMRAKLSNITYDSWPLAGKGRTSYDASTDEVIYTEQLINYDLKTHKKYYSNESVIRKPLDEFKDFDTERRKFLNQWQKANILKEQEIGKLYKLHPELLPKL